MRSSGLGRVLMAVMSIAAVVAACGRETGPARRFMSLGTAGTGGVYYPIGGALASRLTLRDTLRTYTAEVTGGSVENIQRIVNGEMDLGFAIGTTVYEAYHGGEDFAEAQERIRVVAPLYPNLTHVLVRDGADIGSIADFRGRRISVGSAGSGTEQVSRHVLEAWGLSYDDIDEQYLSFTESASALADGAVDGAILSVGYPASAVLEATTTGRVRLLPIDADHVRRLTNRYPYYSAAVLPAEAYPGVEEDVPTASVMNWIVARDDLDDDVVAHVLDILADDRDSLQQAVDIAGQILLTNLYAAPIPLHEGARSWLESRVTDSGGSLSGGTGSVR